MKETQCYLSGNWYAQVSSSDMRTPRVIGLMESLRRSKCYGPSRAQPALSTILRASQLVGRYSRSVANVDAVERRVEGAEMVEARDKGSAFETPTAPDSVTRRATRLGPLSVSPMASAGSNIDSLIYSLVPPARTDERLRRDLADHCKEILSR